MARQQRRLEPPSAHDRSGRIDRCDSCLVAGRKGIALPAQDRRCRDDLDHECGWERAEATDVARRSGLRWRLRLAGPTGALVPDLLVALGITMPGRRGVPPP